MIGLVDRARKRKAVDYSTNDVRDPSVVNTKGVPRKTREKSSAEQRKDPSLLASRRLLCQNQLQRRRTRPSPARTSNISIVGIVGIVVV